MIDITEILNAVFALVAAIITGALVPFVKMKLSEASYARLEILVKTAVCAAEQMYNVQGSGNEKKEYVLNFLRSKGYSVDTEKVSAQVDALIESCVYSLQK